MFVQVWEASTEAANGQQPLLRVHLGMHAQVGLGSVQYTCLSLLLLISDLMLHILDSRVWLCCIHFMHITLCTQ